MAIGDVVNTRTPSMAAPRTSPLYMICRKGLSQRSPLWGVRPKAHQPLVAGHAFWPAMAALFPPAEAVRILAAAGVGASMATGNPLHRCLPCMVAHWALPLDTIGASSRHRHRILFCAHPHCHHPLVACHAPRPAMTTRSPPAEALRPGVAAGVWTSATNGNLRHNRVPCMVAVPTTPHEASTRGACNRHSLFGGTRPHRHHPPRARNAIRPTLRTRDLFSASGGVRRSDRSALIVPPGVASVGHGEVPGLAGVLYSACALASSAPTKQKRGRRGGGPKAA